MRIHPRIETKSDAGLNGWLVPIWNIAEDDWRPDQVYLTVVLPGAQKGPHLHRKRCGRFTCIKGNVMIVTRGIETHEWRGHDGRGPTMAVLMDLSKPAYVEHYTGENYGFATIPVWPGTPAAIYNLGTEPAYVLNMPSPPWRPDDQDEWPVEDWQYTLNAERMDERSGSGSGTAGEASAH